MSQWLALDRLPRRLYYHSAALLTLLGTACAAGRSADTGLVAATPAGIERWTAAMMPGTARRYDLRWTYQTQQGSSRGRAAARFVPPDSLRFDYRGPFGQSGAAMFVGDRVVWSAPEEDVQELIPVAPLFWAALGVPARVGPTARVRIREDDRGRLWEIAAGPDTLRYEVQGGVGGTLTLEMRSAGDVVGRTAVQLADGTWDPHEARIIFPSTATVVAFTVEAIESLAEVDPSIWRRP